MREKANDGKVVRFTRRRSNHLRTAHVKIEPIIRLLVTMRVIFIALFEFLFWSLESESCT